MLALGSVMNRAIRWIAIALVAGSAIVAWPYLPFVLMAMWAASITKPAHRRLARALGGRPRIAASITVGVLILVLVPGVVILTSMASDAIGLLRRLMASTRAQELLRRLVSRDDASPGGGSTDLVGLVMSQGDRAWSIAQDIAGTAARAIIGLVIAIAGTFAVLVDGETWYAWIERHAPISPSALRRLADAFEETGRGLLVGSVGSALAQAITATIIYLALGVPQPFGLGLLTLLVAFLPIVGTALVWAPVAIGFAMTGRPIAAVVLAVLGITVIGTVDNLVRPFLARRGNLQLPTYVVLVAMFGGLALIGPWGVVIAPLAVRLAKEAVSIVRDEG